jgi:gas vesicle protein
MTRDPKVGTVVAFALGGAVGAVAALLLAPKSGEELRGDIAAGVNQGVNQVRSTTKDLKRKAQKFADMAQDTMQDAMDAGQAAFSQAKKA